MIRHETAVWIHPIEKGLFIATFDYQRVINMLAVENDNIWRQNIWKWWMFELFDCSELLCICMLKEFKISI